MSGSVIDATATLRLHEQVSPGLANLGNKY